MTGAPGARHASARTSWAQRLPGRPPPLRRGRRPRRRRTSTAEASSSAFNAEARETDSRARPAPRGRRGQAHRSRQFEQGVERVQGHPQGARAVAPGDGRRRRGARRLAHRLHRGGRARSSSGLDVVHDQLEAAGHESRPRPASPPPTDAALRRAQHRADRHRDRRCSPRSPSPSSSRASVTRPVARARAPACAASTSTDLHGARRAASTPSPTATSRMRSTPVTDAGRTSAPRTRSASCRRPSTRCSARPQGGDREPTARCASSSAR